MRIYLLRHGQSEANAGQSAPAELWPAVHEHHHDPFPPGPWPLPPRPG